MDSRTPPHANPHEREEQAVYVLDGITYLPHYTEKGLFVSPGHGRHNMNHFTALELVNRGAVQAYLHLYTRNTSK